MYIYIDLEHNIVLNTHTYILYKHIHAYYTYIYDYKFEMNESNIKSYMEFAEEAAKELITGGNKNFTKYNHKSNKEKVTNYSSIINRLYLC